MAREPVVLLAAGGTGGHLFPAEALADALKRRGVIVDLATDERATRYGHDFPARATHVIPSATIRGRDPISLAKTAAMLGVGAMKSLLLLRRIRPVAVVGFGGYPTLPPVLAATLRRIPTVIHDANAVMGRANRMLAPRVTAIATSFPGMKLDSALAAKATTTGNPVRPMVLAAAAAALRGACAQGGVLNLLITGGSQGARVMADVVPPAIEAMAPELRARLSIVQQARGEDETRVRDAYARLGVKSEVAPFFSDLPAQHCGGASDRLALRRFDGRRACRHRPPLHSGAAAACAGPGPARQRDRARRRGRRHRAEAGRFHAGPAWRLRSRGLRPTLPSFPPWRPARILPACSMPRSGSPIWCCAWRVW